MTICFKTITNLTSFFLEEEGITNVNNNSDISSVFCDFKWLSYWWDNYSKTEDKLCMPVFYLNGEIIGFAPTYLKGGKTLMWIGTGADESAELCPEYLDIITVKTFHPAFLIKGFKNWMSETGIKELFFIHCLQKSLINKVLSSLKVNYVSHTSKTGIQHYLDLENGFDHYAETIESRSFKKKLTKLNNTLNLDLALDVKYVENGSKDFVKYFDLLKSIHTSAWNEKGETGAFSNELFNEHHKNVFNSDFELTTKNNATAKQVLCVLTLENEVIGISYCLLSKDKCHYYQSGIRKNTPHAYSPGHLLHLAMIKYCTEHNIRYYDFMRGKVSGTYKDSYSALTEVMCNVSSYKMTLMGLPNVAKNIARNFKYREKDKAG